jgi:hypothetical protein
VFKYVDSNRWVAADSTCYVSLTGTKNTTTPFGNGGDKDLLVSIEKATEA